MILGNGDIASAIIDRPDLLFFARGVSNSAETRESEYWREMDFLSGLRGHLVYFSSLCVFYADTRYAQHKRDMEKMIQYRFDPYTIIRLGNISWGSNPHTLLNHLRAQKARGEPLTIQDTFRYVIDKPEFQHWLSLIPNWSCEMNIPGKMLTVQEIVDKYV